MRACCSNCCRAVNTKQLHAEHGGQLCQSYQAHEEPGRGLWLKHLVLFLSGSLHQHQREEEPCFQHAEPGAAAEGILHDLLKRGRCRSAGGAEMGPRGQGHPSSAAGHPSPPACRRDCVSFRGTPCCCVFDPKGMCLNRTWAEER